MGHWKIFQPDIRGMEFMPVEWPNKEILDKTLDAICKVSGLPETSEKAALLRELAHVLSAIRKNPVMAVDRDRENERT